MGLNTVKIELSHFLQNKGRRCSSPSFLMTPSYMRPDATLPAYALALLLAATENGNVLARSIQTISFYLILRRDMYNYTTTSSTIHSMRYDNKRHH
jgi:hypothetical protein